MELIPILSLIMLVATIATFILAIGAYILYKIRERNGRIEVENQNESIQAELVTPSQVLTEARTTSEAYTGDLILTRGTHGKPLYTNVSKSGPQMRQTYVAPIYTTKENQKSRKSSSTQLNDRMINQNKYLRYTRDGCIDPRKDENKENTLKWR